MAHVLDIDRLGALRSTGLLDAPRDDAFDRLVRLASRVVRAPVALLTLVDADRQVFLAEVGLDEPVRSARETPLSHSFCKYVVANEAPVRISDARRDPTHADNGAVRDLGVTAYLGVPVRGPAGNVLGAICVMDSEARTWADDDLAALDDLATLASADLAARLARRDAEDEAAVAQTYGDDREALLALAVEAAGFGVWSTDLMTGATFWDARCRHIFGVSPDAEASAALGQSLIHPADRALAAEAFQAALADPAGAYHVEKRLLRPDGAVRWVHTVGHVQRDEHGQPARILGLATDVTDRKHDEHLLRTRGETLEREVAVRTEALQRQTESSRRLAGALAVAEQRERRRLAHVLHEDLQQILFGLGLHIEADGMGRADQDPALSTLLRRALRLTRSLSHELAAPGPPDGRLDRAVEWLAEVMHEAYGLDIDVDITEAAYVTDDVRNVAVHIVRELLFNVAKHAGVDGAAVRVWCESGSALVEVSDEGVGLDLAVVEQQGKEGLGLHGIRDRIGLIGGESLVEAAPGQGVRVTLRFPAEPRLLSPPGSPDETS